MKDRNIIISQLISISEKCGRMMRNADNYDIEVSQKTSAKDVLTGYDINIQKYIIERISDTLPHAQFIAEELGVIGDINAEDVFIIDPIDGTTNFVHNMDYSALSIAWYSFGRAVFGLVYNPFSDELYTAVKGEGAFLNSRPIHISNTLLRDSIVLFGTSPYNDEAFDETFDKLKTIYNKCQDIRRLGSAALDICHVADGRAGLYFEARLSLWDYAAAQIILKEAGGIIVDFDGKEVCSSYRKTSVIAGNTEIIAESSLIKKEVQI